MEVDVISKLDEARQIVRSELYEHRFSVRAMFSGGICLCGKPIQQGDLITRPPHSPRWMHLQCANIDASTSKHPSKTWGIIEKLVDQAITKQAVWRDDLLELAKLAFLGQWSVDYWLEDTVIATQILDIFGLHRLTAGWRYQSDKARQKYAQKIEKEFAKHKGWICRICKRLIWVKKSVERGIGPVCYRHTIEIDKAALHLVLKHEYFEAIDRGEKTVEYRDDTPYWRKRILGWREKGGHLVVFHKGYTKTIMVFQVIGIKLHKKQFAIYLGNRLIPSTKEEK